MESWEFKSRSIWLLDTLVGDPAGPGPWCQLCTNAERGSGCVLKSESFCFVARTTSANRSVPVKAMCCPCRHIVEPGPVFQPAEVSLGGLDSDPTHLDPGVLSGGVSLVALWTPPGPSGRVWLVSVCFPQARFCSPTSQALLLTHWVHFAEWVNETPHRSEGSTWGKSIHQADSDQLDVVNEP